jgi:hypothetical protein
MQIHELKDENGNVVHGFATASFPLPADHWIYEEPVQPQAIGGIEHELRVKIREALKYTIQVCTSQGKDEDFDPDAMLLTLDNVLFSRETSVSAEL